MAKKPKDQIIQERTEEIKRLRAEIADMETATMQVGETVNAILYEVIKKYGDEEAKITISIPNTETAEPISAEKTEEDTYVIRVAPKSEEG